ncbi:efflux RND transporter periplasmic adaptor subunit [Rhodoferax sp. U11-2br]|uniref:efflux RND transporter periplasmic adaptor subunit n=1 Tax=Rhodoferax sp. U11-2br TaxID=2838878 RepID=UPI001BE8DCD0|nr:efflux RND transporter periplasmic adaptor subunit [Rhodoferax sp. U11-2br]MBT3068835.1 efflux RND transporter periplasmic adaptor subunit [Rhodoferax sp. U11-2br]
MNEKTSAPIAEQTPGKRQRIKPIVALTLFSTLAVGAAAWLVLDPLNALTAEPATKTAVAMTVTDTTARMVAWPVQLDASGAIAPWQEAVIGGQVDGVRLTELLVGTGDTVHRGQVLARFDTEALRSNVAQSRAALRQAEAQAAQALANRDRVLKLKDSGSISEQDVLQSVTQADVASAQLESSRAQLASQELQLRYATVLSPDDGVISARNATVGTVGAVGEELFRLIRKNRLEWRGELTATQLGQVAQGQTITLALPDGRTAKAKVRQMAPLLNSQTRLGVVYADILPGSTARAGMYAQGRVVVAQRPAVVVPAGSVVIRDGRSHVFRFNVQQDIPKVSLQAVKVGRRQASDVEILDGLTDGDRVVVEGAGFLNDGDSVRVIRTTAAAIPAMSTTGK